VNRVILNAEFYYFPTIQYNMAAVGLVLNPVKSRDVVTWHGIKRGVKPDTVQLIIPREFATRCRPKLSVSVGRCRDSFYKTRRVLRRTVDSVVSRIVIRNACEQSQL